MDELSIQDYLEEFESNEEEVPPFEYEGCHRKWVIL